MKFKFYYDMKIITRTFHEDLGTMIISVAVIFRMRNIPVKCCRENQNTHFKFKIFFLKISPLIRYCRKIWYSQTDHR